MLKIVRIYAHPVDHQVAQWVARVADGKIYGTEDRTKAGRFTPAEIEMIRKLVSELVRNEPAFIKEETA